ncbi:MAG: VIT domain-containing protein [Alphaproteobacteria bacterium]
MILGAAFGGIGPARADTDAPNPHYIKKSEVRSGALLYQAVEEGQYVQAPLVGADIDVSVSGATARTRVTQHFFNPTDSWVEGVYVFPLPENSAVDTLKMVVGDRVIIGEIKEKQQAKKIYEKAKREGKKATLMEQERPNVFTNSVANIGPRETIIIQMEYQQSLPQSNSQFSLRVPLVVAPRYNPATLLQTVDFGSKGWAQGTNSEPNRARVELPILDPRKAPPANPVKLTVHLNAGFPLGEVKSHHHKVKIEGEGDKRTVTLDGVVPADKDFELTWKGKNGNTPSAGLFREKLGGDDYLLALITPSRLSNAKNPRNRDFVFVIDNSRSLC